MKFLSILSVIALSAIATEATASPLTDAGDKLFQQRCAVCHSTGTDGKPGPMAPNLRGVVGRKAGSTTFGNYSPALKASNLIWSEDGIATFLTDPKQMVPGTKMVIKVASPQDRAALAAYLGSLK